MSNVQQLLEDNYLVPTLKTAQTIAPPESSAPLAGQIPPGLATSKSPTPEQRLTVH